MQYKSTHKIFKKTISDLIIIVFKSKNEFRYQTKTNQHFMTNISL